MKNSHFRKDGKEKYGYKTEHEAITSATAINAKETTKEKVVVYKCPVCHKYHLGRNGKQLFPEDKKHCKKWLEINKKIKNK